MKVLAVMSASLLQQRLCRRLAYMRALQGGTETAWRALLVLLQAYLPSEEDFLFLLLHCCRTQRFEDLVLDAFRRKDATEQRALLQIGRLLARDRVDATEQLTR